MKVLDLFSGIGGFSLGLERAGMHTVAFCEIDKFCRAVLKKHWPQVPIYEDIRTLTADGLARDGISVDVICGGFPCQDISTAGKGAGLSGERSGLWREYARLIRELRPCYIIVENVAALLFRGLSDVLGDLATLGYDAEWHCIPASYVGAPHRRDRIWIVAYPNGEQQQSMLSGCGVERSAAPAPARAMDIDVAGGCRDSAWSQDVADADDFRGKIGHFERGKSNREGQTNNVVPRGQDLADSDQPRLERRLRRGLQECAGEFLVGQGGSCGLAEFWRIEPNVGRVADGVPKRVDRLKALGNAVVPQIPEMIGRAIMQHEASHY